MPCTHREYLDSRDVTHRRIRTCSRCGTRLPTVNVLIVGEANPYGDGPRYALYPDPPQASGGRLMRLMGLPRPQYLAIPKRNLCPTAWHAGRARKSAQRVMEEILLGKWEMVVMLGRKVADAFGHAGPAWSVAPRGLSWRLAAVPHPSGLCREWNDPASKARLRDLMADLVPGLDWGTVE